MGRTVGDVALLMSVGCGPHPLSPTSLPDPIGGFDLPQFALDAGYVPSLQGVRVGFAPDLGGLIEVDPAVREVIEAQAAVLAELGAEVDETSPDLSRADEVFDIQRAYDFAGAWGPLVQQQRDRIKDFVVWNTDRGTALTAAELLSKDRARVALLQALQRFFADHELLVTTTSQVLPFDADIEYPTEINGVPMPNYLGWMRAATLISATGCPAVSVPAGFSPDGLPVGIQLITAPGRDVDLLRYAHAFEAATEVHLRHPDL